MPDGDTELRLARIEQALLGLPNHPSGLLHEMATLRQEVKDQATKAQERWDRLILGMIGGIIFVIASTVLSQALIVR